MNKEKVIISLIEKAQEQNIILNNGSIDTDQLNNKLIEFDYMFPSWICLNCGQFHEETDGVSERNGDNCTIWCINCGVAHNYTMVEPEDPNLIKLEFDDISEYEGDKLNILGFEFEMVLEYPHFIVWVCDTLQVRMYATPNHENVAIPISLQDCKGVSINDIEVKEQPQTYDEYKEKLIKYTKPLIRTEINKIVGSEIENALTRLYDRFKVNSGDIMPLQQKAFDDFGLLVGDIIIQNKEV